MQYANIFIMILLLVWRDNHRNHHHPIYVPN